MIENIKFTIAVSSTLGCASLFSYIDFIDDSCLYIHEMNLIDEVAMHFYNKLLARI